MLCFVFRTGTVATKGLVTIGSCPLYAIQNAFINGFTASNKWQIEEIVHDFSFFFSQSTSRREDYLKLAEIVGDGFDRPSKRGVISRWVEVGSIIERMVKQWPVVVDYFLTYLPKVNKTIVSNDRWKRIKELLEKKQIIVLFHFFQFLYKHTFWKRIVWLQEQRPLIHILYEECVDFYRNLLQCFIKDELLVNKTGKQLLTMQLDSLTNQKPEAQLEIGDAARNIVKDLSMIDKNVFIKDVRSIYALITVSFSQIYCHSFTFK